MYLSRGVRPIEEILNAPVGSKSRVLAEAIDVKMRNAGTRECHITVTARHANSKYGLGSLYIQVYYDREDSANKKNAWLLDAYNKINKEIKLYGYCQMEMLVTKKSSDKEIIERTGQPYQYACSINEAPNSNLKLYLHDNTLGALNKEIAKNKTLDDFYSDAYIRRK